MLYITPHAVFSNINGILFVKIPFAPDKHTQSHRYSSGNINKQGLRQQQQQHSSTTSSTALVRVEGAAVDI